MPSQRTDLDHHWPASKTPFNCDPLLLCVLGVLITSHRRTDNIAVAVILLQCCIRDLSMSQKRELELVFDGCL